MGKYVGEAPKADLDNRVIIAKSGDIMFSHGGHQATIVSIEMTISYRLELYPAEPGLFCWKAQGVRPIIGIGGIGEATQRIMKEVGA